MASPQSQQPSKMLRVGVVQDGRILEERHILRGDITIGHDGKNTIVLPPSEDLPARFALFENRKNQYQLVFDDVMQGQVDLGSSQVDFERLRKQGLAQERGSHYVLPLQESARGKVDLGGNLTLFFQFVTPPPASERPTLPPDVQGGFWKELDRTFFLVLAASLLLHFVWGSYIYFAEAPREPELTLDELEDRFVRADIIPKQPPKQEQVAEAPQAAEEAKPQEEAKDSGDKATDNTPKDAAQRKAEVVKKVSGKGLLKILGSSGSGSGGAFADVLGGSTGGGEIAEALAGAGGVGVATAESIGAGGQKGGGTGNVAGIGDLGTSGGGKVDLGTKKEVEVKGRVNDAAPEVDSADVDREALARYVKSRLKAIQNCYEKELKRNPNLKGKVVVRFSIMPSGRTGDIEIEENTLGNDAVGSCIRTVIRGWTFPFKPDDEVPVAYPFVFSPAG
jgi:outer membrane biosynthesis protein TonB